MATRKTTNSALKHTPKIRRTTASALSFRKLEQDLVKNGHLTFARDAETKRLIAPFLRANGYPAEAKKYAEEAKTAAFFAKACQ